MWVPSRVNFFLNGIGTGRRYLSGINLLSSSTGSGKLSVEQKKTVHRNALDHETTS